MLQVGVEHACGRFLPLPGGSLLIFLNLVLLSLALGPLCFSLGTLCCLFSLSTLLPAVRMQVSSTGRHDHHASPRSFLALWIQLHSHTYSSTNPFSHPRIFSYQPIHRFLVYSFRPSFTPFPISSHPHLLCGRPCLRVPFFVFQRFYLTPRPFTRHTSRTRSHTLTHIHIRTLLFCVYLSKATKVSYGFKCRTGDPDTSRLFGASQFRFQRHTVNDCRLRIDQHCDPMCPPRSRVVPRVHRTALDDDATRSIDYMRSTVVQEERQRPANFLFALASHHGEMWGREIDSLRIL